MLLEVPYKHPHFTSGQTGFIELRYNYCLKSDAKKMCIIIRV